MSRAMWEVLLSQARVSVTGSLKRIGAIRRAEEEKGGRGGSEWASRTVGGGKEEMRGGRAPATNFRLLGGGFQVPATTYLLVAAGWLVGVVRPPLLPSADWGLMPPPVGGRPRAEPGTWQVVPGGRGCGGQAGGWEGGQVA